MNTIKDVAKEANVSIATVSRVINGKDKVKKETREKIQRAIEKLNYVPDQAARTMKINRTRTIGMVVPLLSNEYWAKLAEIIQRALIKKGYTLIISTTNYERESDNPCLTTLLERKVDGLIIGTLFKGEEAEKEKYIQMFIDQRIPLVSFSHINNNITSISGDNLRSSMEAVEYLIRLGHQKIAFIGSISTGMDRELGYRNALMLNDIAVDETLILSDKHEHVYFFSQYGYQCAKELVLSNKEFDAIFCSNDLIAIGAIKALEEMGLDVPSDKVVVGFDDIDMAGLYRPALTTVKQPIEEMANAAIDVLIEQIENPVENYVQKKIIFPMQLMIRESCGGQKKT
ncbi:LacI family DNA-binding transcriptional regulator [Paenibacillus sp. tmac-D7]|uniref:LacI family DNA-binding transcriptional regulator n=1 Tax=Paenibacillus sp. tmac-D7 TaxID=2591462 RepID=UPI0011422BEA|nr:LacI family DNA-binding transcriptional regulator [Paenibacillus sp. tmac-D7]